MTDFLPQPNADGLVKLSGTIRNLKVTRGTASFVFTESDQTKMGVIAIAAAVAGMGGQAMSTAGSASALEEEADYLEFDLDDKHIKGWLWRNPVKEGDVIEVVAERAGSHWEAYGVSRSKDKILALYPHCSRGKAPHVKNALKWWLIGGGGVVIGTGALSLSLAGIGNIKYLFLPYIYISLGTMAFFALMTWSLSRRWMPFVRLAEKVFHALELPDPSNIDLVKSSKARRRPDDPGELGTFYFRY